MPNRRFKYAMGNTIAEYGLIFALILVVSIAAISMLGGSISELLGKASGKGGANPASGVMSLLSPTVPTGKGKAPAAGKGVAFDPRTSPTGLNTKGFISVTIDRKTGLPQIKMATNASGATNTTSVEGGMWNTYGAVKSAQTLDEMAAKAKDPNVRAYLKQMSDKIFLMGAAQAELDGVPALDVPDMDYNNPDALADLFKFNQDLTDMMSNPPAKIRSSVLAQAVKQAQDAYNISQTYINALDTYIDDNGVVGDQSFSIPPEIEGTPGAIIENAKQVALLSNSQAGHTSLADGSALNFIKQATTAVLSDGVVQSAKVESTLTNAVGVSEQTNSANVDVSSDVAP